MKGNTTEISFLKNNVTKSDHFTLVYMPVPLHAAAFHFEIVKFVEVLKNHFSVYSIFFSTFSK